MLVDSNGIYFVPQAIDSIRYGVLPDSILNHVDIVLKKIKSDSAIKSNYDYCYDCPQVSILASSAGDSIKLFQAGEISKPVRDLISKLEFFLEQTKGSYIKGLIEMRTTGEVAPPAPPRITK